MPGTLIAACLLGLLLLVPSQARAVVSDGLCAGYADDWTCFNADWNSEGNPSLVTAYYNAVAAQHDIATAMEYQSLPSAFRDAVWDAFREAETNWNATQDTVSDIANPAYMADDPINDPEPWIYTIWMTKTEARESFARKVAHALWIEIHDITPWSLTGYSLENLRFIFDPNRLCIFSSDESSAWDPTSDTEACYHYGFVDHSPRRIYDTLISEIGVPTGTQLETWLELLTVGNDFRHVATGDNRHATTITESMVDNVSRYGCHSATRIMVAFLRSINIPAGVLLGFLDAAAHSNAKIPTIDGFLAHGDDIYTTGEIYPIEYAVNSLAWADAHLTRYGADNDLWNSRYRYQTHKIYLILRGFVDWQFCAYGFDYVVDSYLGLVLSLPQDQHWLDALEDELVARTGCSP